MTPLILLLAAVQAGLLLWGSIHLSNAALRPKKSGPIFWALATLALPLAIAKYSADHDRNRALCSAADCIILALCVAGVRVVAVSREEERLALEHEDALRRSAEAAEAARQAWKAEQIKAAAEALAARTVSEQRKPVDPTQPPRHLTPSILRGGAPSPRLPTSPRK
jgi:choline-glycine betaine transporter